MEIERTQSNQNKFAKVKQRLRTPPDFKTQKDTLWQWYKDRHVDWQNRIENPGKTLHIWLTGFLQMFKAT